MLNGRGTRRRPRLGRSRPAGAGSGHHRVGGPGVRPRGGPIEARYAARGSSATCSGSTPTPAASPSSSCASPRTRSWPTTPPSSSPSPAPACPCPPRSSPRAARRWRWDLTGSAIAPTSGSISTPAPPWIPAPPERSWPGSTGARGRRPDPSPGTRSRPTRALGPAGGPCPSGHGRPGSMRSPGPSPPCRRPSGCRPPPMRPDRCAAISTTTARTCWSTSRGGRACSTGRTPAPGSPARSWPRRSPSSAGGPGGDPGAGRRLPRGRRTGPTGRPGSFAMTFAVQANLLAFYAERSLTGDPADRPHSNWRVETMVDGLVTVAAATEILSPRRRPVRSTTSLPRG